MIRKFPSEQLLSNDTYMLLDDSSLTISLLQAEKLIGQQQFKQQEWNVMMLFLNTNFQHCTYAEALSIFSGESIETCQNKIQTAILTDKENNSSQRTAFFTEMRLVNDLLIQCQRKLLHLDLHLAAILETGYIVYYNN